MPTRFSFVSFILPLCIAWPAAAQTGVAIPPTPAEPAPPPSWESAAPVESTPAPAEAPSNGEERIEVTSNVPDVVLHTRAGERPSTWVEKTSNGNFIVHNTTVPTYAPVCTAPCRSTLALGTYQLALSHGTGSPLSVDEPVVIHGPSRLEATYISHAATRALGWLIVIGGAGAGGGIIYAGRTGEKEYNPETRKYEEKISPGALAGGILVAGVGIVAGVILAAKSDKATINVVSLPKLGALSIVPHIAPTSRERGLFARSHALDGAGLALQLSF